MLRAVSGPFGLLHGLEDFFVDFVGERKRLGEERFTVLAVFGGEGFVGDAGDVDEHVEPRALYRGAERERGASEVARGAGVEAAYERAGELERFAGELHHFKGRLVHHFKGRLGAAFEGFLHCGFARGFLLVGVLRHGEDGADGVEGFGVAVHYVDEAGLEVLGLFLRFDGELLDVGVFFLADGEGADHRGEADGEGADHRGEGRAERAFERRRGAAAGGGRVGGHEVYEFSYLHFCEFHRIRSFSRSSCR